LWDFVGKKKGPTQRFVEIPPRGCGEPGRVGGAVHPGRSPLLALSPQIRGGVALGHTGNGGALPDADRLLLRGAAGLARERVRLGGVRMAIYGNGCTWLLPHPKPVWLEGHVARTTLARRFYPLSEFYLLPWSLRNCPSQRIHALGTPRKPHAHRWVALLGCETSTTRGQASRAMPYAWPRVKPDAAKVISSQQERETALNEAQG
jgi:hypothetical protein